VIFVCIPTHNEADTIGVLLWKTRNVMGEFGRDYRIVVHDDASSDETPEVLQRYRRSVPLTILRSDNRIGYGASMEKLLRHVVDEAPYPKRDCAVVLQADFSESPSHIVPLVKILEGGADIVAGTPTGETGEPPSGKRLALWAVSKFRRGLIRNAPVSDPLTGLRAYRGIVLKKALRDRPESDRLIRSDGWAANVELLGQLAPHARRIAEIEYDFQYDLQARPSRFRPWPAVLGMMKVPGSLWASVEAETA